MNSSTTPTDFGTCAVTDPGVGWLLLMPGGYRYSWQADPAAGGYPDETVWALFEPDPEEQARMRRTGWSVRPGYATDLFEPVAARKVPA